MSDNLLEYKGYFGTIEFSLEDKILFGKIIGMKSLVSYEGTTLEELEKDFQGAVDDYLEVCENANITPEKTYKGSFNVRISPDLHKELAIYASSKHQSLNASVETAIRQLVENE